MQKRTCAKMGVLEWGSTPFSSLFRTHYKHVLCHFSKCKIFVLPFFLRLGWLRLGEWTRTKIRDFLFRDREYHAEGASIFSLPFFAVMQTFFLRYLHVSARALPHFHPKGKELGETMHRKRWTASVFPTASSKSGKFRGRSFFRFQDGWFPNIVFILPLIRVFFN